MLFRARALLRNRMATLMWENFKTGNLMARELTGGVIRIMSIKAGLWMDCSMDRALLRISLACTRVNSKRAWWRVEASWTFAMVTSTQESSKNHRLRGMVATNTTASNWQAISQTVSAVSTVRKSTRMAQFTWVSFKMISRTVKGYWPYPMASKLKASGSVVSWRLSWSGTRYSMRTRPHWRSIRWLRRRSGRRSVTLGRGSKRLGSTTICCLCIVLRMRTRKWRFQRVFSNWVSLGEVC